MSLEDYKKSIKHMDDKKPATPRQYPQSYDDRNYSNTSRNSYAGIPQYIQLRRKTNGLGTAGFVLSVVSIFVALFSIFPFAIFVCLPASLLLCVLAFIFSAFGLLKSPRGLALAGFIVSGLGIVGFVYFVSKVLEVMQAIFT